MRIVKSKDGYMTLDSLIKMYEDLINEGRILKDGAGAVRLEQLRNRSFKRRKWLNTPYAKRKFMQAPEQI